MNLYARIIYLYFKKDFTMVEIAEVLCTDLKLKNILSHDEIPGRWLQDYSPVKLVKHVIGNEIAQHYNLGEFNKFQNVNNRFKSIHNQSPHRQNIFK